MIDLIVIGAGPAGMMAAGTAAENGYKVLLIEKMERVGKKLAITGKGRCNITNLKDWDEFSLHVHPNPRYLKPAFYFFPGSATVAFFNEIGLPTVLERGDRVYPQSQRSIDVINALRMWLERVGVMLEPYQKAIRFEMNTGEKRSTIAGLVAANRYGNEKMLVARHYLLATGGMSYPATGSTGDGYALALGTGHTIAPVFPSLVAALPVDYDRQLEGIQLKNVQLSLFTDGIRRCTEEGEVFFTDLGIEGPVGLRLSRQLVVAMDQGQRAELRLNLKPALTREQLSARWKKEAAPLLRGYMPAALVEPFIRYVRRAGVTEVEAMQDWRFAVASYGDWARAVVTAGGVRMAEVDARTMRSRLVDNLSFAGEVLDIDADSGGYNLQVAFSTGRLAGAKWAATAQYVS